MAAAILATLALPLAGPSAQSRPEIALAIAQGRVDDTIVALASQAVADAAQAADRRVEAAALEQLGQVHAARGDFVQAQRAQEGAAEIWSASADPAALARVLEQLAESQIRRATFADAAVTIERLRTIRDGAAAPEPLERIRLLELQGTLHSRRSEYAEAREALDQALAMARSTSASDARLASLLHGSGDVAYLTGDITRAAADYAAALDAARRAFGTDHPALVPYLDKVAVARYALGDLGPARDLRLTAVSLAEASLPPCHPDLLTAWNDLAISDIYFGDYAGARRLFERALASARTCLGPTHSLTATTLGNVGAVLRAMGDLTGAEQMQRDAIAAWTANRGASHPFVALAVEGLADVLAAAGRLTEASAAYDRALRISSAGGDDDPTVARLLTARADVLARQRRYPAAMRDLDRAAAIYERRPAVAEPEAATQADIQLLRGSIERALGHGDAARQAYASALATRERLLGPSHPLVAETRTLLARVDAERGDAARAFDEAMTAEAASRDHLRQTVRFLTERQALEYISRKPAALDLAMSLVSAGGEPTVRAAFDALVRSRAVILDELAARTQLAHDSAAPAAEVAARFVSARQRYANLVVRSLREAVPRDRLVSALNEAEEAEFRLAEQSAAARAERARADAGLDAVLAALPPQAALVAFIRYQPPTGDGTSAAYGALVAGPAPGRSLSFVPIGTAPRVEALVRAWRTQVSRRPAVTSGSLLTAGTALRKAVWDPVAVRAGDAARVFVVTDGALSLVNFAALPRASGGYLIEDDRVLHYLSTERDLLMAPEARAARSALIVGGPAFSAGRTPVTTTAARASDCRSARPLDFSELPGARVEAAELSSLWTQNAAGSAMVLSGAEATETAVKAALGGRGVIHLATHGFFLASDCAPAPRASGTRAVGGVVAAKAPPALVIRNPLLLSGLALAGANQPRPGTDDDGILTAEEIASLNLHGTQWAVLSACDTGLGEIRSGEGVLGLRRAFQVAGARTVIMSLWSVDDQATRRWMQALYEARLSGGLDTADAVRAAGVAMLARRRAAGASTNPFYWAAFVAAGDWR